MTQQPPKPGTFWRHSKTGNHYTVIAIGKVESEGGEGPNYVVYSRISDDSDQIVPAWEQTWIRPVSEWQEDVVLNDGSTEIRRPRFVQAICLRCGDPTCPPKSERAFKSGEAQCVGWRK